MTKMRRVQKPSERMRNRKLARKTPVTYQTLTFILSTCALLVSLGSAFIAYEGNQRHLPHLTVSLSESSLCDIHVTDTSDGGVLTTCWRLILSNQSENRAVVTSIALTDENKNISRDGEAIIALFPDERTIQSYRSIGWPGSTKTIIINPKDSSFPLRIESGDAALVDVTLNLPLTKNQIEWIHFNPEVTGWHDNSGSVVIPPSGETLFSLLNFTDTHGVCLNRFLIEIKTTMGTTYPLRLRLPERLPYISKYPNGYISF
jgi:hypothetical protein